MYEVLSVYDVCGIFAVGVRRVWWRCLLVNYIIQVVI